jgi:hypothetical protein
MPDRLSKTKLSGKRITNPFRQFVRWLFPEWYVRWRLRRLPRSYDAKIEAARAEGNSKEVQSLEEDLRNDIREYSARIDEIETHKLLARARKVEISLDDIPLSDEEESHWEHGYAGTHFLTRAYYSTLQKVVRQAEKDHRKERREIWEFRLKVFTAVLSAITGLVGAVIGLVAFLKK